MYKVLAKGKFVKSISRLRLSRSWNEAKMRATLDLLSSGAEFPAIFKDHQLQGELSEYRECHVKHDLLLVYSRDETSRTITLFDIGTHDDLFGR
jgi:mRNA interferase YafQ